MILILALALTGCALTRSPSKPFDTITVRGTQAQPRALVVVLPGFIYDAEDLQDFGVADAIHQGWPEADVVLTSATMQYYWAGVLAQRVHEIVIEPARRQGYSEIWLTGGSLGGAGVMLYEWAHPGELAGIALFSPALGSDDVIDPIREAGGVAQWDPGPVPAEMDGDNWDLLLWKMIKDWTPAQTRRVWVACGTDDPLFADVRLLEPKIPAGQYYARAGGHDWDFWLPMLTEVFGQIRLTMRPLAPATASCSSASTTSASTSAPPPSSIAPASRSMPASGCASSDATAPASPRS